MKRKLFLWIFTALFVGSAIYASFFVYKIYSVGRKVNIQADHGSSLARTLSSFSDSRSSALRGAEDGRLDILLLGMAGKGKPGQYLTDTLMVASINLETNRVSLLSLPRDLYVRIPDADINTKINSIYQYGLGPERKNVSAAAGLATKAVTEITGLDMDYFVIINFDGFEQAIDDIGGVNIINERDIHDSRYPGPNYSYETFELSKGFHNLDGATALKYARQRHGDPEGDFGRAKRQQQIMQAAKNKIFSTGMIFNAFALNDLLDTLGENIQTDISPEEFYSFFELTKRLDTQNINNVVIDAWNKESLLKVSHVQYGAVRAFVLVPRVGNYSEIQELAENIFNLNELKRKREEIAREDARIFIENRSGKPGLTEKIEKVLKENLNYKNISVSSRPGKMTLEKTIAYDMTDGQKPFTLNELVTKLPAEASYEKGQLSEESQKNETIDIFLVLGKDVVEIYDIEEGTLDDLNRSNDEQENLEYNKN